jgi:hypothetical protein
LFAPPAVGVAAIATMALCVTALFTALWQPINATVPAVQIAIVKTLFIKCSFLEMTCLEP